MPRIALFFLLFLFFAFFTPAFAQPEKDQNLLLKIESQIRQLQANQEEMLKRQQQILEELDRLRIWIRRS